MGNNWYSYDFGCAVSHLPWEKVGAVFSACLPCAEQTEDLLVYSCNYLKPAVYSLCSWGNHEYQTPMVPRPGLFRNQSLKWKLEELGI